MEDCDCSGCRDESERCRNGVEWRTSGNKVTSVELDGASADLDLSEKDADGEGERGSLGSGDLVPARDTSDGNRGGKHNKLGISW